MITSDTSSTTLNGNGVTTAFPFTFKVFNVGQLQAWVLAADGTSTQTTDFTAALTDTGGTVTYPVAGTTKLPAGAKITILRAMEFTQEVDLVNGNEFRAEVIEDAFDNVTMQIQQVKEAVDRSVKVDPGQADPALLLTQISEAVTSTSAHAASAGASAVTATAQAQTAVAKADEAADSAAEAQAAVGGLRASVTDTTLGPLESKLQAGEGLALSLQNPGANESILAAVDRPVISAARILNHAMNGGF